MSRALENILPPSFVKALHPGIRDSYSFTPLLIQHTYTYHSLLDAKQCAKYRIPNQRFYLFSMSVEVKMMS